MKSSTGLRSLKGTSSYDQIILKKTRFLVSYSGRILYGLFTIPMKVVKSLNLKDFRNYTDRILKVCQRTAKALSIYQSGSEETILFHIMSKHCKYSIMFYF